MQWSNRFVVRRDAPPFLVTWQDERRLHHRQQVVVEELRHLGTLGVHDAVKTEVEVGLVELEQLLQQSFKLFVVSTIWSAITRVASPPGAQTKATMARSVSSSMVDCTCAVHRVTRKRIPSWELF